MDLQKNVNGKLLRCGFTTGSCAAAAAKAAAMLLLTGEVPHTVTIQTPKGVSLTLDVLETCLKDGAARCAVQKDSGDDPDVTNGVLVCAEVRKRDGGHTVDGGEGVGRVTKPGLDQPVGAAAINSTPRKMIAGAAEEACRAAGYTGGLSIVISIPGGEALAKRTFNPRIGIEGGISVIGTTGIVEPMSDQALVDTIRLELRQAAAAGRRSVLLTPGNYGETFARETLGLVHACRVNCSNFIGDTVDACVEYGFEEILLVGHIGKLVKLGIGLMNTHSSFGDGRMETLMACALEAGAGTPLLREVAGCVSTDAVLAILSAAGLLEGTMAALQRRISASLLHRVPEGTRIGYICFTNAPGLPRILCKSENAGGLIHCLEG